jgi:hypothetical protein
VFGLKTLTLVSVLAILTVAPAAATTTYYIGSSGETSFNTAVGGLSLLDPALTFSGSPGTDGLFNASGTGIDFLGFDDFLALTPLSFTVSSGKLTATAFGEVVKIAFPTGSIFAFGMHFTNTSGLGNWCVDSTTNGCSYNVPETAPAVQFFGVVSGAPINAPLFIHALNSGPKIVFTNFEAFADPVPEPRTMLLVGLGLVILPLIQRRAKPAA